MNEYSTKLSNILKDNRGFLAILCAFLASRLVIAFFYLDTVYGGDERYIGFISKELFSLKLPFFDYATSSRGISEIIPAVSFLPFSFLFGNSYIVLKIFALFLSTAGLIIWYKLMKRISLKAALIFSVLYVFSPVIFTNSTLMIFPGQYTITLASGLFLALFLKVIEKKGSVFIYSCMGFIAGMAIWYSYAFLAFLSLCFAVWLKNEREFFMKRKFIAFAVFFVLGILPWFSYNLSHVFNGMEIHGQKFYELGLKNLYFNAKEIFGFFIPAIFSFSASHYWAGYPYYALFILCFLLLMKKNGNFADLSLLCGPRGALQFIVVCFACLYVILLAFSSLDLKVRYLFNLFPFIFSILALGICLLNATLQKVILAVIIFFHVFSFVQRLPYANFPENLAYTSDAEYARLGKTLATRGYSGKNAALVFDKFAPDKKSSMLLRYLEDIYSSPNFSLPDTFVLIKRYPGLSHVFYESFLRSDIDEGGSPVYFKYYAQNLITVCREASASKEAGFMNNVDIRETEYFYLGRLTFMFKPEELYSFYGKLPETCRDYFISGFAYQELNRLPETVFFKVRHLDNFSVIRDCIANRSRLAIKDRQFASNIEAAYVAFSCLLFTAEIEDDYMALPLNINNIKDYLASEKDSGKLSYIRAYALRIFEKFGSYFEKGKIEFLEKKIYGAL
ncbi:MAG: hypothetical protein PHN57_00025 [Candidatus Omnitrophica bacterium]|nr:hypothetical protein [Candidatus Omnitrophota bacterium]